MEENAEYYFDLALKKVHAGDYLAARAALGKAIELDPTNPKYYMERGYLRLDFEADMFGVEDFSKVIEYSQDPGELALAYLRIALSHERLGKPEALLNDLSWLIEHGAADAVVYSWRATYLASAGNFAAALEDCRQAHQLSPTGGYLRCIAIMHYRLAQYQNALQALTSLLASGDTHPSDLAGLYRWRGSTQLKLGDHLNALADFNEQLRLKGKEPVNTVSEYIERFGLAE